MTDERLIAGQVATGLRWKCCRAIVLSGQHAYGCPSGPPHPGAMSDERLTEIEVYAAESMAEDHYVMACDLIAEVRRLRREQGPALSRKNTTVLESAEMVIDDHDTAAAFLGKPAADLLFEKPSPMSDEQLALIESEYEGEYSVRDLIVEIRRLRRENQMLMLSRGDLSIVGGD